MTLQRRDIATIAIDHRGNVAGGFNNQSVDWQLRQQRRMQDNHTRQVQESFSSNPISLIRRTNASHVYWKELEEVLPRKIKLAKELQMLLKPVNTYNSWNHKSYVYGTCKCLDNPLNIIKNAYSMKVDTSKYLENRNYFSNLYKSMRSAGILHSDILSVWGNPYLGVVTKWDTLSYQRRQNILKDYPETERIAGCVNEAKQALTYELSVADYDTKQFIQDFVIVGLSVWAEKQFKLPNTLMAPVYATRMERAFAYIQPKYEKIAYKLSDRAGKLYRKAEDFFKKKANAGLKKGTDSNALKPRIQNTPQEVMDYIKGLTDKKGYILNRCKTKDGYHYYEVMKKFEYKGIKFQKGEYISRDTRHHEIEYFRNKNTHIGALDPVTGKLKPKSRKPERKLHI